MKQIFSKKSKWAYQGKMPFDPELNKQAQDVIFSRKVLMSPTFRRFSR